MASEILAVPEEHLAEVIAVIRAGLASGVKVSAATRVQLIEWCHEEASYLKTMDDE